MRIQSQISVHNRDQFRIAYREGKRKHDKVRESVKEASQMAGEMIAQINNDHSVKVDDVIRTYRPDYLGK